MVNKSQGEAYVKTCTQLSHAAKKDYPILSTYGVKKRIFLCRFKICSQFLVKLALFTFYCKCAENRTFLNILQQVKTYFSANIYHSPFVSH
jgi:hypothetical protein